MRQAWRTQPLPDAVRQLERTSFSNNLCNICEWKLSQVLSSVSSLYWYKSTNTDAEAVTARHGGARGCGCCGCSEYVIGCSVLDSISKHADGCIETLNPKP